MIRDLQVNPFNNEILTDGLKSYVNVPYTIPLAPNYPDLNPSTYMVWLDEAPYLLDRNNYPIIVKSGSNYFVEVAYQPVNPYEFRIAPYQSARPNALEFSIWDAGRSIEVSYYGYGSPVTFQNFLSKTENLNDLPDKATARTNLEVYSKTELDKKFFFSRDININYNVNYATTDDFVFSPGYCFSDDFFNLSNRNNSVVMYNTTTLTKKSKLPFSEGNNGGMIVGSSSITSTYYIYMIAKDSGQVDFCCALYNTSPTLPSGFTKKRRIGAFRTDASNNPYKFYFFGANKLVILKDKVVYWNLNITDSSDYQLVLTTPDNLNVRPLLILSSGLHVTSGNVSINIANTDYQTLNNPGAYFPGNTHFNGSVGSAYSVGNYTDSSLSWIDSVITTTNRRVYLRRSTGSGWSGYPTVQLLGWYDFTL